MDLYKKAGVDIESGNKFVNDIKELVDKTRRKEVLAGLGGFAGLFKLQKYREPVLVAATDGVGTKILLANQFQRWDGIGIDCVAMCVNDIACYGAEPLFFLDYLATSKIDRKLLKTVVASMAKGCQEVGCALLGGETAEMPGVYPPQEWDCAGFAVGVAEKDEIIDGSQIHPGDAVIGIASSGFHSNGFSLIRKILQESPEIFEKDTETLLTPTFLYPPLVLQLKKEVALKGIAHITGGGLIENPPRILPHGTQIKIEFGRWPVPEIMRKFWEKGGLSEEEFLRVFNAGIGLVIVVSKEEEKKALGKIGELGWKAWTIGAVYES